MNLVFRMFKETRRTLRFEEVVEAQFAEPKVGWLYVTKNALGEMGYEEGDELVVTVEVKKERTSYVKRTKSS